MRLSIDDNTISLEEKQRRIDYMSGFMLDERFETLKHILSQRTDYMTVCLEDTYHSQNASAAIRSCEAFGIQDIYAVENLTNFKTNDSIVRGADKWTNLHKFSGKKGASQLINELKNNGYRIVATSPHADDITPSEFDVEKGRFALFFGTEHAGISSTVLDNADTFIKIPMYGFVESLNLSACVSILLSLFSEKLRKSDVDWRLTQQRQTEILYRWMQYSLKDSYNILKRYKEATLNKM